MAKRFCRSSVTSIGPCGSSVVEKWSGTDTERMFVRELAPATVPFMIVELLPRLPTRRSGMRRRVCPAGRATHELFAAHRHARPSELLWKAICRAAPCSPFRLHVSCRLSHSIRFVPLGSLTVIVPDVSQYGFLAELRGKYGWDANITTLEMDNGGQ